MDVALHEAVFNVMESLIPEYSAFGAVREPGGSALPGIAPSNAYPCSDGDIVIGANQDKVFARFAETIGKPEWAEDPRFKTHHARGSRQTELDDLIGEWTQALSVEAVMSQLAAARVPAGKVYTAKDIAQDPHYRAREMILQQQTRDGYTLEVPGIVPKLSGTPGSIRCSAPHVGDDTDRVLQEMGLSAEQIAQLRERKIVQ